MALTVRGRRTAYDNISQGNATGRELTILGDTVSKAEVYGGGYMVSTSNNEHQMTNIANDGVSTSNTAPGPENFKQADGSTTDPTDERLGA